MTWRSLETIPVPCDDGTIHYLHKVNSIIYKHPEVYENMDHVFEQVSEDRGIFYFREMVPEFDEFISALGSIGVEAMYPDEPSEMDIRSYHQVIGQPTLGEFSISDFIDE